MSQREPIRDANPEQRWAADPSPGPVDGGEARSWSPIGTRRDYIPVPGSERQASKDRRAQLVPQPPEEQSWEERWRSPLLWSLVALAASGLASLTALAARAPARSDLLGAAAVSLCVGLALGRLSQPVAAVRGSASKGSNDRQLSARVSAEEELKELQGQGRDSLGLLNQYIKPDTEELDSGEGRTNTASNHKTQPTLVAPSSQVREMLSDFGWDLDVQSFATSREVDGRPIYVMGTFLIASQGIMAGIPDWMLRPEIATTGAPAMELEGRVRRFLLELDRSYGNVSYHNSIHACDVMKNMHLFFRTDLFHALLEIREWTHLISVLAAALHDVGHPGTTNSFHIVTRSELALRYNDKSPLEQMHVSTAFMLMASKPATDWFGAFHKEVLVESSGQVMHVQNRFRRVLIAMVLGTDPLVHNEHIEKLRDFMDKDEEEQEQLRSTSSQWQCFFLEVALHASDIANPTYEWPVMVGWTKRLFEEFWVQGDLEKKLLGSTMIPLFDRDKMDIAAAQSGFISFIARGLWEPVALLVPEMDLKVMRMQHNLALWEARKAKGLKALPSREEEDADRG